MAQDRIGPAQEIAETPLRRGRKSPARGSRELYAALDLGTNSCRMLVAEPLGVQFRIIDAFAKSVRLGTDLERTGALSDRSIDRTIRALMVCAAKLRKLDVRHMRLVATEACRRAANGMDFLAMVRARTGLDLELIAPEEEARLAVISCAPLLSADTEQVLVFDIGGGSTELVWIALDRIDPIDRQIAMMQIDIGLRQGQVQSLPGAEVVDFVSIPLGVATLHQRFEDVANEPARFALMSWFFEEQLAKYRPYQDHDILVNSGAFQMLGTSGTVPTVAAAPLGLKRYDRRKVDGLTLRADQIERVIGRMMDLGREGRSQDPAIGRDRAELIMSGAAILQTLLRIWPTDRLSVADRGLREGMLMAMMSGQGALKPEQARHNG